ncbi:DNA-binding PadR family transcriptional regulator [Evansella vedderi]|uniref:DNA-binding PadR family transcriptional regulator n=1 Tax=Evansella vedderi TaxID=38282 RepID=A0ABT9ZQB7_9BACI|nr:PadR family transcriptional regulator [Evansella vedderi]MDQ0253044.1 DNA-binding PadR family transcriptional regulator [Evansella vedderi]
MNDPLNKLKNSMKKTVFKDLSFSHERKNAVKEAIQRGKHSHPQLHFWKEETILYILDSIQYEEKHGYEISTHLYQKNDNSFIKSEGQLYTLLHLLENKGIIQSEWIEEKKYYSLTTKGKKHLAAVQEDAPKQRASLKHLLEEAST